MNILEMKPHPLAAEMPALADYESAALEESMKGGFDPGLPVVVWLDPKIGEDRILDGVNRLAKAKKLGLDRISWRRFEGTYEDAVRFVMSRQLGRRSTNASQRAFIMAAFRKRMKECGVVVPLTEAAKAAGVSDSQMEKASSVSHKSKKVLTKGIRGELTVGRAVKQLKRIMPEESTVPGDPWEEIQRTADKLTAAEDALKRWASEYLDDVLDRRGAEMLRANLASRSKIVAGKKVLGMAMIDEMIQTIKRNKPKDKCPTCKGAGCSDCGERRYITPHELAQQKNAERNGKK